MPLAEVGFGQRGKIFGREVVFNDADERFRAGESVGLRVSAVMGNVGKVKAGSCGVSRGR